MDWSNEYWSPVLAMLVVDVVYGVMNILIKKAIDEGTNSLVIITLRQFTATVFMAPIAFLWERKSRPKLTASIFVYLFVSALLGATLTQYFFFLGLRYTSATFACAFLNMVPVFTFLISLPFRSETLNVKNIAGKAKILGTAVCVGGAMILTLYKGVALTNASPGGGGGERRRGSSGGAENWTVGSVALFAAAFCYSSWFLVQAKVGKKYPALYSGAALIFFLSFLQSAALTFATQRDVFPFHAGKFGIVTVLYSGVVGSGLGFLLMSWCVKKRGPVFTAAFSPLTQIVVAIIDFSILHEQLHLGSVLGSVLVIFGLYVLLWGKSREAQNCTEVKQVQGDEENGGQQKEPATV